MQTNAHKKLTHFGPGGIKCSCCTPFSKGKLNRKLANRQVRRTAQQEINQALAEEIDIQNFRYRAPEFSCEQV